ncbi:uncharacterized protein LOC110924232 [Helianthus annuus]|uniref:uncharacterized protein LOC110924232 n=1 Tax=Helianthus annuus TaxID=4232 RepID=UPI000B900E64|nr:uncharacterized protein LOC110924232 [Helianthus annuus]
MEAFASFVTSSSSNGTINGINLPNGGPILTHLIFADDVMLMGEWSENNIRNIGRLMRGFYLVSGVKLNLNKSCLYGIGASRGESETLAGELKCKHGTSPFVYLGVKVGGNMKLYNNWPPVTDKFSSRLSLWKVLTLSIGGRVTLIKVVLDSLPLYYFSLYPAPKTVLSKLEKLRRLFFWGGSEDKSKMSWVRWDKAISPIDQGGLGLGRLKDAT